MMFLITMVQIEAAIAVTAVYIIGWVVYCRYFHPLASIPGPFLASVSRIWIVYKTAAGDMEDTQRRLHKRHGYLIRIAPNEVACSDPEAIKVIYRTTSPFTKTDFYDVWSASSTNYAGHFAARDEKEHSQRRRIVNNAYSMPSVLESEKAIDQCTEMFCENMRDMARQKTIFDLCLWTSFYSIDVLGVLFFGKIFGFMNARKDVSSFSKAADLLLPMNVIGGILPSYLTKPYILSTALFSPGARGAIGAIHDIRSAAEAAVAKRRQEIDGGLDSKRDILRKMLEIIYDRGEKMNFTHEDVIIESMSSLFAGADTTSAAMNSILYYLMRHESAYKKLTAEIDHAVTTGALSIPVKYADAIKLPYLRSCINEGMRVHPSVALTMPRTVPIGGATISGFYIPAGYRVGVNCAVVHYDKGVFGEDADEFNPDRWLEGDTSRMSRTLIPFGAGTRICIGKNISMSELYKLIPHMLWEFNLRLDNPAKKWKTHNSWFHKQSGVDIYLEERIH